MESNTETYYTPQDWEFCEGFPYQQKSSFGWVDMTCTNEKPQFHLKYRLSIEEIRVKRLDHQDLESLGFYFGKVFEQPVFYAENHDSDLSIEIEFEKGIAVISDCFHNLYNGKIRNKFHLQQILKDIC